MTMGENLHYPKSKASYSGLPGIGKGVAEA